MSQYRDGVFSVSSPAPRYGILTTVFENGSLGGLNEDVAASLDPVLAEFAVQMAVTVSPLGRGGTGGARGLNGATAVNIAKEAREVGPENLNRKLALAIAAGYAASYFGLPENTLLKTVAGVCDTLALTGNQRAALHQEAMDAYWFYLRQQQELQERDRELLEKKGVPMSGVFRDGVLGNVYRDGVLGGAYEDGVLGHAYHDGVLGLTAAEERVLAMRQRMTKPTIKPTLLPPKCWTVNKFGDKVPVPCKPTPPGVPQQRAVRDGSLGAPFSSGALAVPTSPFSAYKSILSNNSSLFVQPERRKKQRRAVSGMGGGCGCAGLGEEAAVAPTPFYKKPLVIGGAAVALGVVIYAVSKR